MLKTNYSLGFGAGAAAAGNQALIDVLTTLGLTTDLKLCLDAGDSSSYSSGQSWLARSGGGYDFHFGASDSAASDDPTFNGSSGGLSSAEYMSTDGGDFFEYDQATPETWMNNMHKNNAIIATACWMFMPSGYTGGEVRWWTTSGGSSTTRIGTNYRTDYNSTYPRLRVGNAGGEFSCLHKIGDTGLDVNAWNFVAYSLNESTGSGGGFLYLNGAYNQVSSADTWTSTYSSPTTSDIGGDPAIMGDARTPGQSGMVSGGRVAMIAVWEGGTQISKANFDDIYANTNREFR